MGAARRAAVPLAVGLSVAAVTFVVVLLATGDDGGQRPAPARPAATTSAAVAPDPRGGRLVFARMGCGSCHRLAAAGSSGPIGPPLDPELPHHTRATLLAKIVRPGTGTIMPQDFAQRMSFQELQSLVDFLIAARDHGRGSAGGS